ncbi:hypothetical protein C174_17214 [Bacillus mycoides FSL H7-687]|nr:hypothetical protein C174_17214 [Bacillus mycoides FSL H7-687]
MDTTFINGNVFNFFWNICEILYKIIKKAKNYGGKL